MVWFEIKKVLGRPSGKIALFLFVCVIILSLWITILGDEYGELVWVNEQGDAEYGYAAHQKLREAQNEWAGELDEEHLADIIRELNRIAATPEYQSDDYKQNDIAFHWRMGIDPVRYLLYRTFSPGLQNFNYYIAETLSPSVAGEFYSRRVELLRSYLYEEDNTDAKLLSDREKEYLISQYEKLEGPIYYDYYRGWHQVINNLSFIMLLGTLVLGYLVSGIFSNEFKWKSDAVFFTTYHGHSKAVSAKIKAGIVLVSVLYWGGVLICTLFTLGFCGFDGGNCAIQFEYYRSFYNLTFWQTYLLFVISCYIGILFMMFLCMWVSAKTRSSVFATTIPFILIFVSNRFNDPSVFVKLREINTLLNNYDAIKEKVVFVYAIKDEMFTGTERTKFFDFIIPVIPVINSTNSGEILLDLLQIENGISTKHNITQDYISDVAPFISDMRVLYNIYNEFLLYKQTIKINQGLTTLDDKILMSLIIFKNLQPDQFALLQNETGLVKSAFSFKSAYINRRKTEIKNEIDEHTQVLDSIDHDVLDSKNELKYAMLCAITGWNGMA